MSELEFYNIVTQNLKSLIKFRQQVVKFNTGWDVSPAPKNLKQLKDKLKLKSTLIGTNQI